MTVASEINHNQYVGNEVTTSFDYGFRIFKNSHLLVQVSDLDGVITTLVLGTDYTVTGVGASGGKVVLTTPLATGWAISIDRNLPIVQETDLRNQGTFYAETHEDAFDYLTMLIQRVYSYFTLALRKPSWLSKYYDAEGNKVSNLAGPELPADAANKGYVDATATGINDSILNYFKRTIRVPEDYVDPVPAKETRKNKLFAWGDSGQPLAIPASSGSASEVYIELAKPTGSTLIGDPLDNSLDSALARRLYFLNSVTQMVSKDFSGAPEGLHVMTYANRRGVSGVSEWIISSVQDASTYSLTLPGGKFANLVCTSDMNYSSFDFGGTDVQNVAAVNEGNRVARAQPIVRSLSFPAGSYQIGAFTLDVDKRAFKFWGAGWDSTTLISTTSGISMHHLGIDPRDRARDRSHFYQQVGGFMLDGNIDGNGANAASRSVCTAHYAELSYKSVGHRLSNIDIHALVVHWKGLTGSRINGSTVTAYGLRVRYNSVKLDGYIGGAANTVACAIGGPKTTLASAASVGDTTITVTSASGFNLYDIPEIQGGSNLEAPYIIGISGNVLTLDKALVSAHSSGAAVAVPVVGTSLTGTVEVGQIQIGNSAGTELHGLYAEESKIVCSGRIDALEIHGSSLTQANPTIQIDYVDRLSTISIHDNNTAFSVQVNVLDKSGAVNSNFDPYNCPSLNINQNTRGQAKISLNGAYNVSSLKLSRTYDTTLTDQNFARMEFTGLYGEAAPGATVDVFRLAMAPGVLGYDGYTFDISATCRRSTSVTAGILKRAGGASTDGTTNTVNTVSYVSSYTYFNASTGVDITFGGTVSRSTITCRGEPSGGQTTKFSLSGIITSIL